MEEEPSLETRLDRMWTEHILACLAIINTWSQNESEQNWTDRQPGVI